MGQAFESVDGTSFLSESTDGGVTWSKPWQMFDKSGETIPLNDNCKITLLPDGRLVALGYQFFREDPELPLGNPQTGGLLPDEIYFSVSEDDGKTWSVRTPSAAPGATVRQAVLSVLERKLRVWQLLPGPHLKRL